MNYLNNFYNHHIAGYRSDLGRFYQWSFIYELGFQMINFFAPIYLYKLGYGLIGAIFFLVVGNIAYLVNRTPISHLIISFGIRKVVVLSAFCWVGFGFIALYIPAISHQLSLNDYATLAGLSFLLHFSLMSYYSSRDYYLSGVVSQTKKYGKNISMYTILSLVSAFLAPIAGGIVAQLYSFKHTVVLGGALMILSLIPILFVKDKRFVQPPKVANHYLHYRAKWQIFKKIDKRKLIGESISLQFLKLGLYWPLYVGLVIFASSPYSSLGILSGVGSLFSVISVYVIGRLVDKGYGRKVVGFSVLLEIGLGISRFFVSTPVGAIGHDIAWKNNHSHRVIAEKWYLAVASNHNQRLGLMDVIMHFRHLFSLLFSVSLLVLVVITPTTQELEMIKYFCAGVTPLAVFIWLLRPDNNQAK